MFSLRSELTLSHVDLLRHAKSHVRAAAADALAWIVSSRQLAAAHVTSLLDRLCAAFEQAGVDDTHRVQLVALFAQLGANQQRRCR